MPCLRYVALLCKRREQALSCLLGKHRSRTSHLHGPVLVIEIGSSAYLWAVRTASPCGAEAHATAIKKRVLFIVGSVFDPGDGLPRMISERRAGGIGVFGLGLSAVILACLPFVRERVLLVADVITGANVSASSDFADDSEDTLLADRVRVMAGGWASEPSVSSSC